jgi:hypothetical protein
MISITSHSSELQMLVNIYLIYMKSTSLTYLLFTVVRGTLGTLEVAWHASQVAWHAMHASARHCTVKSGGPSPACSGMCLGLKLSKLIVSTRALTPPYSIFLRRGVKMIQTSSDVKQLSSYKT